MPLDIEVVLDIDGLYMTGSGAVIPGQIHTYWGSPSYNLRSRDTLYHWLC
jgi:hypothetical protein